MEVGPAVAKWIKAIAKKLNDLITYKVENEKSKIDNLCKVKQCGC